MRTKTKNINAIAFMFNVFCPLVRDSSRTKTLQIIYTDKNTSGIQPKPLNKEQTKQFFDILLGNNSILNAPNGGTIGNHFNKYDDFGNVVTHNQADAEAFGSFTYLGKHGIVNDVTTQNGLYYIKARYYDAKLGRFLTQDPIWSTNLYPYAGNNPISKSDVNGEFWNYVVGAAVNVGIGYATSVLTGQDYSWKDAGRDALIGAAGVGVISGAKNLYNTYKGVSKISKVYKTANSLTNKQVVQQAANTAENTIGGTGRFAGTTKHSYAKNYVDDFQKTFGDRGLETEAYFNNGKGNIGRLDVQDNINNIIYDYKFGVSGWRSGQLAKYQRNFSEYIFTIVRPY